MQLRFTAQVVVVCVVAMFGFSQEITGDIRGIVRDPSGAVVNGATVQVFSTDRNAAVRTAVTGGDGSYVAPLLPVGHYTVQVEAAGFKKYTAGDIDLHVSDRRVVDITLQLGSASEIGQRQRGARPD